MSSSYYLRYEIEGIVPYIYSVPKLKYVVGGSLLLSSFDREAGGKLYSGRTNIQDTTGEEVLSQEDIKFLRDKCIYTGAGCGTYFCESEDDVLKVKNFLIRLAHSSRYGISLFFGKGTTLQEAKPNTSDLHTFLPDNLEGEPCQASGLWPVKKDEGKGFGENKDVHPIIWNRCRPLANENTQPGNRYWYHRMDQEILDQLKEHPSFPESLKNARKVEFLTVVRDSEEVCDFETLSEKGKKQALEDKKLAQLADKALGARNRWAILAMDANDLTKQVDALEKMLENVPKDARKRCLLKIFHHRLPKCIRKAFIDALSEVVKEWWNSPDNDNHKEDDQEQGTVVLPFRPLILGGDDILCLCHSSYALDLARKVIEKFEATSTCVTELISSENVPRHLTISAGIVFTKVTLPLFLSIPYSQRLLKNAKKISRSEKSPEESSKEEEKPKPSAIDWEHITETMIDKPAKRRERDMIFIDPDMEGKPEICLTRRPYRANKHGKLKELIEKLNHNNIPCCVLANLVDVLKLPWMKRVQKLTELKEQQSDLIEEAEDFFNVFLDDLDSMLKELKCNNIPNSILADLLVALKLPWAKRVQRLAAMKKQQKSLIEMEEIKQFFDIKNVPKTLIVDAILLLEEDHRMMQTTT